MAERYTSVPRPVLWLVPGLAPEGGLVGDQLAVAIEPFYLSTLPVTNRQLEAFAPHWRRSPLAAGDEDPALGVELALAEEYCRRYGALARKPIRLPSAAEWEHACRAGTPGRWFWGAGEAAADEWTWHLGNSGSTVPALAAKKSNGFGLYAMLGGVWEWAIGESGPVLCGGSWRTPLAEMGCDTRRQVAAGESIADVGFRIARSLRGLPAEL